MYEVVRRAMLMEDEGRESYVGEFSTKEEAQRWIALQAGEYFGSGCYYVREKSASIDQPSTMGDFDRPRNSRRSMTID